MKNTNNDYCFENEKRKYRISLLSSIDFYEQLEEFSELIERISQQNFASPKFFKS